jgi:uncharacterized protein
MGRKPNHQPLEELLDLGYDFPDDAIILGGPLTEELDEVIPGTTIKIPLRSLNKHGLIAGATGTGKTKSLQVMAEQLSAKGIPVFLADLKGDLTGIALEAKETPEITARINQLGCAWKPSSSPVELLSLSGEVGTQLRVPVRDLGPLLMAKIMDCTETQQSVLQILFRFVEERGLTMIELSDFIEVLKYLTSADGRSVQSQYGGMATVTLNVILRKAMELDTQGVGQFFGLPKFDVRDLMRTQNGRGVVTVMNLTDVQTKPKVFSTFMMWMLTELYATSPELGDPEQPSLVFFFDEAHLLFDGASKALNEKVELTSRMIRSKGIGVFFITQAATDVPDAILAQLGNRIQHALRAFTPRDQRALKATAMTFPTSHHYDVREALQQVGTGEALVTVLGPNGSPTPTTVVKVVPPSSTMDVVDEAKVRKLANKGKLRNKYKIDPKPYLHKVGSGDPPFRTPKQVVKDLIPIGKATTHRNVMTVMNKLVREFV